MRVLDFGFVYSLVVYVYGSVLGAYNECDTGELAEHEA